MAGGFWTMAWHTAFLRHKSESVYEFLNHYDGAYIVETLYRCECGTEWWD